jgi:hypothetical protein
MTIQEQMPVNYKELSKHDSSHKAEDASASNAAIEILNSSLQAVGESPKKKNSCEKRSILRKGLRKSPM